MTASALRRIQAGSSAETVAAERELIRRLLALLCSRMSKSGHLLQAVTQESRGNCLPPWNGCGPACIEAQAVILAADEYLTATETRQPTLFEEAV